MADETVIADGDLPRTGLPFRVHEGMARDDQTNFASGQVGDDVDEFGCAGAVVVSQTFPGR